jgi:hypothetical protein
MSLIAGTGLRTPGGTRREQAQKLKDLEAGQRAFDQLRDREKAAIIDALHAEQVEKLQDYAQREWTYLLDRFQRDAAEAAATIAKWNAGRLTRAPEHLHHELEWADSLFEAAAVAWISHEVLQFLPAAGPAKTERWLIERLGFAVGPGTSSSTSANLMKALEAKAYARALETLRWGL